MDSHYSELDSQILDYLYVPLIATAQKEDFEWDMTPREREILAEAWEVFEALQQDLAPLKTRIEAALPFTKVGLSLAHLAYFYLLDQGKRPSSWEEFLNQLASLSEGDLLFCLSVGLSVELDREIEDTQVSLIAAIEQSDMKPAEKWYWSQAVWHPLETMQEITDLLSEIGVRYQPYFDKYQKEREAFAARIDLEELMNAVPHVQNALGNALSDGAIRLFVISPWHTRFSLVGLDKLTNLGLIVTLSTRMDRVLQERNVFDMEDFVATLKVIGDETRYQILVELLKPHAKNKDIAEKLGITNAAVSFHTQKLITSQVLVYAGEDKPQKYQINQRLLEALIDKLQTDLT
ncbi:DNA-binding transcriptional ArsR family regulator [Streptococcus rupicaprae]|uniref:DNA-binding transcriptional ArsR family regulator n=1 Tax=Streptococcus rupicaprae TaxID=759619 RepID=A0ABV2FHF3_9STRE